MDVGHSAGADEWSLHIAEGLDSDARKSLGQQVVDCEVLALNDLEIHHCFAL